MSSKAKLQAGVPDASQPRVLGLFPPNVRTLVDEVDGDIGVVEVVVVCRSVADLDVDLAADADAGQTRRDVAVRRGRQLAENPTNK